MSKKRKAETNLDQVDQPGSRDGKKVESSRDTVKPSFAIRLTYEKICDKDPDHWITGSEQPDLVDVLQQKFPDKGVVSLEKGKNGKLHFQVTVCCFKSRKRRSDVRNFLLEHYSDLVFPTLDYCEPCERTIASLQYCKKEESHVAGPWQWGFDDAENRDLTLADMPEPYPWQQELLTKYEENPSILNAKIDWYVDPEGQKGKTTLCKFLALKHKFYLLDGDFQKMKFQVAKNPRNGYMMNVPRSKEGYFSYAGLEAISDQFFCDTFGSDQKGMVMRKGSHIAVFANWYPDTDKMTANRYNVYVFDSELDKFVINK